jgi:diguanylate cyclase (GGDEF)-like protein
VADDQIVEPVRGPSSPVPRKPATSARGPLRATGAEREALLRVAAAAAGGYDLDEVLVLAAEEARRAVGAASVSISRWEREEGVLRTVLNVGDLGPGEDPLPENELHPVEDDPKTRRLLHDCRPYFNAVDDAALDVWSLSRLQRGGKESDLGVPIVAEGEAWGEVYATTAPGQPRFRAEDLRFLEAVAGQIAIAIGRAELFSRVSRLAYEDPLTGLANRRAVEERLERAAARATERGSGLAVLLCDVDELKTINDTHGHEAGDRTLRLVGDALVGAAAEHPGSVVGRLSGDEFCVVIEGAGLEAAREVATGALERLAESGANPAISVSCGAAVHGPGVETPAQLLRAADGAQYRAKRSGGGQLFTAESGDRAEGAATDRRALRRGLRQRVRAALEDAARRLDGELVESPAVERIEAVASGFAEALNAAAWAVSFAPAGGDRIHTISVANDREARRRPLRPEVDLDAYPLSTYPITARLVRAGSGAITVGRDDPDADPAERSLLEHSGRTAVVMATAAGFDGIWLLEIYADDASVPLTEAELEIGLALRAAVPSRPEVGRRSELLDRRTRRRVELTGALASRLATETDQGAILEATADEIAHAMGYGACAIVRLREDDSIEVATGRGRFADPRWPEPSSPGEIGLIRRSLRDDGPVIAGDVMREPDYQPTPATLDTRSELDVPVRVDGAIWGAITVHDTVRDAFDDDDALLLGAVADQLGTALRSTSLYERLERAYLGTAEALSAALEAKDSYTAEHSHAIVRHAEQVGRRLGLGESELRALRYAAALHDIGKLAVPEAVLGKPGALTIEERRLVERHTVVGEQILAPVEFLADVLPLVRGAHERWDGDGYPDGLGGERIPLGARIIFACDAYDAMTSARPYRGAMAPPAAREELRRVAGSQLDPRVVEALLDVVR